MEEHSGSSKWAFQLEPSFQIRPSGLGIMLASTITIMGHIIGKLQAVDRTHITIAIGCTQNSKDSY